MTDRDRTAVLFVWFVLYRLLCGYLLFPLAQQKLESQAFYAFHLCTALVLAGAACALSMKYLFAQYSRVKKLKVHFILIALACLVAVQLGGQALMRYCGRQTFHEQAFVLQYSRENPFGYILSGILIMPVFEELVFRVCLFELVQKKAGTAAAAVSANLLFGLSHVSASLLAGNGIPAGAWLIYFLCGMILQQLYLRTDYFTAALTHSLFNLISMIV